MTCTVLKEKRFLKVVTPTDDFCLTIIAQITFKKISYYLSRIFKLVKHMFKKKKQSLVAELQSISCIKFPDIFAEVMRVIRHWIRRMNRKLILKTVDAAIVFSTNVMNEETENNKQTNCFLKIFIRKPISLPVKAIHVTLTGSSGSVSTSKISWAHGKISIGNSMICSDIWRKYLEWYFEIVKCNFTSR